MSWNSTMAGSAAPLQRTSCRTLTKTSLPVRPSLPDTSAIVDVRSTVLPDVPTLKEAGVDGVDVRQWYGLFAPANTPKPIIAQLNRALNQVLADKEIAKRTEEHGADVETSTPEQFGDLVKSELAKWKGVVQRAKLTAD
jgi:tripartite-type tricarboxylate transporter receptor subunit TctC